MSGSALRRAAAFVFLPVVLSSIAFSQATLTLRQPVPGTLKPSDLWEITIINTSGRPFQGWLEATVSIAGGGTAMTLKTGVFTVSPGARVVTASQSSTFPAVISTVPNSSVRAALNTLGEFPAGQYRVTINLMMASPASGSPVAVATDGLEAWIVESNVQPVLLSPPSGSENDVPLPVFSWTLPVTMKSSRGRSATTFRLRIVELLGQQSPLAAMQNNPAWLELNGIAGMAVPYPPSARALQPGHRYAWSVTSFSGGGPVGTSEIWVFTQPVPSVPSVTQIVKAPVVKNVPLIDVQSELLTTCATEVPR